MKYTIYKNKKTGYWHLNYTLHGKRQRPGLGTKDKKTAELQAELDITKLGADSVAERVKLYRFLELYEADSLTKEKSENTLANEASIIRTLKAHVKDQPIAEFDTLQASQFFASIQTRTVVKKDGTETTHTITGHGKNYYLRALRTMWAQALKWHFVAENVFKAVDKFSTETSPPRVLRASELKTLFDAMKVRFPDLCELVTFYLLTGMRRNEALNLKWSQVDFEDGVITISKAKGRKYRVIPLLKKPREILQRRLDARLSRPFADQKAPSTISHEFLKVVRDAGIEHAKLHDTRKTFGTMLARDNVSPFTIMQWLGHSDDQVTMQHYIGLDRDTADRVDDIGAAIGGTIEETKVVKETKKKRKKKAKKLTKS